MDSTEAARKILQEAQEEARRVLGYDEDDVVKDLFPLTGEEDSEAEAEDEPKAKLPTRSPLLDRMRRSAPYTTVAALGLNVEGDVGRTAKRTFHSGDGVLAFNTAEEKEMEDVLGGKVEEKQRIVTAERALDALREAILSRADQPLRAAHRRVAPEFIPTGRYGDSAKEAGPTVFEALDPSLFRSVPSSTLCRALTELLEHLDRRERLIALMKRAYHRDVFVLREHLFRSSQSGSNWEPTYRKGIPSVVEMEEVLRLFSLRANVVPVAAEEFERLRAASEREAVLRKQLAEMKEEATKLGERHARLSATAEAVAATVDEANEARFTAVEAARVLREKLAEAQRDAVRAQTEADKFRVEAEEAKASAEKAQVRLRKAQDEADMATAQANVAERERKAAEEARDKATKALREETERTKELQEQVDDLSANVVRPKFSSVSQSEYEQDQLDGILPHHASPRRPATEKHHNFVQDDDAASAVSDGGPIFPRTKSTPPATKQRPKVPMLGRTHARGSLLHLFPSLRQTTHDESAGVLDNILQEVEDANTVGSDWSLEKKSVDPKPTSFSSSKPPSFPSSKPLPKKSSKPTNQPSPSPLPRRNTQTPPLRPQSANIISPRSQRSDEHSLSPRLRTPSSPEEPKDPTFVKVDEVQEEPDESFVEMAEKSEEEENNFVEVAERKSQPPPPPPPPRPQNVVEEPPPPQNIVNEPSPPPPPPPKSIVQEPSPPPPPKSIVQEPSPSPPPPKSIVQERSPSPPPKIVERPPSPPKEPVAKLPEESSELMGALHGGETPKITKDEVLEALRARRKKLHRAETAPELGQEAKALEEMREGKDEEEDEREYEQAQSKWETTQQLARGILLRTQGVLPGETSSEDEDFLDGEDDGEEENNFVEVAERKSQNQTLWSRPKSQEEDKRPATEQDFRHSGERGGASVAHVLEHERPRTEGGPNPRDVDFSGGGGSRQSRDEDGDETGSRRSSLRRTRAPLKGTRRGSIGSEVSKVRIGTDPSQLGGRSMGGLWAAPATRTVRAMLEEDDDEKLERLAAERAAMREARRKAKEQERLEKEAAEQDEQRNRQAAAEHHHHLHHHQKSEQQVPLSNEQPPKTQTNSAKKIAGDELEALRKKSRELFPWRREPGKEVQRAGRMLSRVALSLMMPRRGVQATVARAARKFLSLLKNKRKREEERSLEEAAGGLFPPEDELPDEMVFGKEDILMVRKAQQASVAKLRAAAAHTLQLELALERALRRETAGGASKADTRKWKKRLERKELQVQRLREELLTLSVGIAKSGAAGADPQTALGLRAAARTAEREAARLREKEQAAVEARKVAEAALLATDQEHAKEVKEWKRRVADEKIQRLVASVQHTEKYKRMLEVLQMAREENLARMVEKGERLEKLKALKEEVELRRKKTFHKIRSMASASRPSVQRLAEQVGHKSSTATTPEIPKQEEPAPKDTQEDVAAELDVVEVEEEGEDEEVVSAVEKHFLDVDNLAETAHRAIQEAAEEREKREWQVAEFRRKMEQEQKERERKEQELENELGKSKKILEEQLAERDQDAAQKEKQLQQELEEERRLAKEKMDELEAKILEMEETSKAKPTTKDSSVQATSEDEFLVEEYKGRVEELEKLVEERSKYVEELENKVEGLEKAARDKPITDSKGQQTEKETTVLRVVAEIQKEMVSTGVQTERPRTPISQPRSRGGSRGRGSSRLFRDLNEDLEAGLPEAATAHERRHTPKGRGPGESVLSRRDAREAIVGSLAHATVSALRKSGVHSADDADGAAAILLADGSSDRLHAIADALSQSSVDYPNQTKGNRHRSSSPNSRRPLSTPSPRRRRQKSRSSEGRSLSPTNRPQSVPTDVKRSPTDELFFRSLELEEDDLAETERRAIQRLDRSVTADQKRSIPHPEDQDSNIRHQDSQRSTPGQLGAWLAEHGGRLHRHKPDRAQSQEAATRTRLMHSSSRTRTKSFQQPHERKVPSASRGRSRTRTTSTSPSIHFPRDAHSSPPPLSDNELDDSNRDDDDDFTSISSRSHHPQHPPPSLWDPDTGNLRPRGSGRQATGPLAHTLSSAKWNDREDASTPGLGRRPAIRARSQSKELLTEHHRSFSQSQLNPLHNQPHPQQQPPPSQQLSETQPPRLRPTQTVPDLRHVQIDDPLLREPLHVPRNHARLASVARRASSARWLLSKTKKPQLSPLRKQ